MADILLVKIKKMVIVLYILNVITDISCINSIVSLHGGYAYNYPSTSQTKKNKECSFCGNDGDAIYTNVLKLKTDSDSKLRLYGVDEGDAKQMVMEEEEVRLLLYFMQVNYIRNIRQLMIYTNYVVMEMWV